MVSGAYRNQIVKQITVFGLLGPSLIRAVAAADAARATHPNSSAPRPHRRLILFVRSHVQRCLCHEVSSVRLCNTFTKCDGVVPASFVCATLF